MLMQSQRSRSMIREQNKSNHRGKRHVGVSKNVVARRRRAIRVHKTNNVVVNNFRMTVILSSYNFCANIYRLLIYAFYQNRSVTGEPCLFGRRAFPSFKRPVIRSHEGRIWSSIFCKTRTCTDKSQRLVVLKGIYRVWYSVRNSLHSLPDKGRRASPETKPW